MEMSSCAPVSKNQCVAASERIEPERDSLATLIEEPSLQATLRRLIAGVSANAMLQEDLMQEGLVHLWKVERYKPGQTKSWR